MPRATTMRFSILLMSALLLTGAACSSSKESTKPTPQSKSASATASGSPVKPGSHEDWCDEHGVPESLCTRCNPALGTAFKATGDWCNEHGLPESQCLKCNPSLTIKRPPKNPGG